MGFIKCTLKIGESFLFFDYFVWRRSLLFIKEGFVPLFLFKSTFCLILDVNCAPAMEWWRLFAASAGCEALGTEGY